MALVSVGSARTLLNVLQCPGQLPTTKNYLAPNVSSMKVGSPVQMLIGSVCKPAAGSMGKAREVGWLEGPYPRPHKHGF